MNNKKLKVIFFGNPGYGGIILEELLKHDVEIVGVFHQTHNKFFRLKKFFKYNFSSFKKIRINCKKIIYSNKVVKKVEKIFDEKFSTVKFNKNVVEIAKERQILLFDSSLLFDKKCLNELKKFNIDIILVASFSELIPKDILRIPKLGAINIHPSLLPKYRWAIPEFCSIYNGEKEAGITFHLMDEKFDNGNILLQKELNISDNDTTINLKIKLAELACKSLKDFFHIIYSGNLLGRPQDKSKATYCKLQINSDQIHEGLTVNKIKNITNAYYGEIYEPYCKIKNKKIYVLSYGDRGLSYKCRDGEIKFNIIRYKHKIYRNKEIEKLNL